MESFCMEENVYIKFKFNETGAWLKDDYDEYQDFWNNYLSCKAEQNDDLDEGPALLVERLLYVFRSISNIKAKNVTVEQSEEVFKLFNIALKEFNETRKKLTSNHKYTNSYKDLSAARQLIESLEEQIRVCQKANDACKGADETKQQLVQGIQNSKSIRQHMRENPLYCALACTVVGGVVGGGVAGLGYLSVSAGYGACVGGGVGFAVGFAGNIAFDWFFNESKFTVKFFREHPYQAFFGTAVTAAIIVSAVGVMAGKINIDAVSTKLADAAKVAFEEATKIAGKPLEGAEYTKGLEAAQKAAKVSFDAFFEIVKESKSFIGWGAAGGAALSQFYGYMYAQVTVIELLEKKIELLKNTSSLVKSMQKCFGKTRKAENNTNLENGSGPGLLISKLAFTS